MTTVFALLSLLPLSATLPSNGAEAAAVPEVPLAPRATGSRSERATVDALLDDLDAIIVHDTRDGTREPLRLAQAQPPERGPRLGTTPAAPSAPNSTTVSVMPEAAKAAAAEAARKTAAEPPVLQATASDAVDGSGPAFAVHLASYKSEQTAERGWKIYRSQFPGLLGDLNGRGVPARVPGKGDFIRLLAGPLSSKKQAEELCAAFEQRDQYCTIMMFDGKTPS